MAGVKLKGYVLLESMIAMIVVMLCFGMAVMIYNNVVASSRQQLKVLARIRLENEAVRAKQNYRLIDETLHEEAFDIRKQVKPYRNIENLYQLTLTAATPDNFQLARYDELLYRP